MMSKSESAATRECKASFVDQLNTLHNLGLNRIERERFKMSLDESGEGWTLNDMALPLLLQKRVIQQDKSFKHTAEKYLFEAVRYTMLELMLFDAFAHPAFRDMTQLLVEYVQVRLIEEAPADRIERLCAKTIAQIVVEAFKQAETSGVLPVEEGERWYQEYQDLCQGYGWFAKDIDWTQTSLATVQITPQEALQKSLHEQYLEKIPLHRKFQDLVLNQLHKKTSLRYHARGQINTWVEQSQELLSPI